MHDILICLIAGTAAGTITGILGSGGGMILIPLLSTIHLQHSKSIFPLSLAIMFPVCIVILLQNFHNLQYIAKDWSPYFAGSMLGAIVASYLRNKISAVWLHRIFGALLLWGGLRCILQSI